MRFHQGEAFGGGKQPSLNIILHEVPRPDGDPQARDGSLQAEIEMLEILAGIGPTGSTSNLGPRRSSCWPCARMQQHRSRIHSIEVEEGLCLVGAADRTYALIEQVLREVAFRPSEIVTANGKIYAGSKDDRPAPASRRTSAVRFATWNCVIFRKCTCIVELAG